MTSNQIVEAVENYVRDENAKYALLIDGVWGSGKTYLYENYLAAAIESVEIGKDDHKKNVYISLYGISNIDSLAKQLITNYLIYVKGNENIIVKKGLKPLAGLIGVASSAFSFSLGPVSADLSGVVEKIGNSINVKDMIICFDDLERCTIPINEFFGFVNNLIEHCNCKVIILADENNIGKIYANTNIEWKYLTVLSGNRKVVEHTEDEKNARTKRKGLGKDIDGEITVEDVKKLNELLYSENYLYKDIKEKVIGKTLFYCPDLKDVITELINGNEKNNGIIQDKKYKDYLIDHISEIVSAFRETENRNLRIIKSWILSFKKIFDITTKYYSGNKYYEDILGEFLHYSIWVAGAQKKNKKIIQSAYYSNQDMVFWEGNEYTHIIRYSFIDAWICRDAWDDSDLSQACKVIIQRKEREDMSNPLKIRSTGTALYDLRDWRFMEDDQVKDKLNLLVKELKENQYAYYDYANILINLLYHQKTRLFTGNIEHIKDVMIEMIEKDSNIQDDDEFPRDFVSVEIKNKYNELYTPISEARKKRNYEISKEKQEEEDIYRNADAFKDHCTKKEDFYCSHRSFVDYLDFEKLYALINASDNEDVYTICRAFQAVYFMGNIKEYYMADIEGLKKIRENIKDESVVKQGGIVRQIALNSFAEVIKQKLIALGVDEDQL